MLDIAINAAVLRLCWCDNLPQHCSPDEDKLPVLLHVSHRLWSKTLWLVSQVARGYFYYHVSDVLLATASSDQYNGGVGDIHCKIREEFAQG